MKSSTVKKVLTHWAAYQVGCMVAAFVCGWRNSSSTRALETELDLKTEYLNWILEEGLTLPSEELLREVEIRSKFINQVTEKAPKKLDPEED